MVAARAAETGALGPKEVASAATDAETLAGRRCARPASHCRLWRLAPEAGRAPRTSAPEASGAARPMRSAQKSCARTGARRPAARAASTAAVAGTLSSTVMRPPAAQQQWPGRPAPEPCTWCCAFAGTAAGATAPGWRAMTARAAAAPWCLSAGWYSVCDGRRPQAKAGARAGQSSQLCQRSQRLGSPAEAPAELLAQRLLQPTASILTDALNSSATLEARLLGRTAWPQPLQYAEMKLPLARTQARLTAHLGPEQSLTCRGLQVPGCEQR
mmetsp:Transcript_48693/g.139210  ORF Transcript_48693/g.139210 Transcript_48693/m.139210 type:complete len:271 (+) Transcript_48693:768-1580(+)